MGRSRLYDEPPVTTAVRLSAPLQHEPDRVAWNRDGWANNLAKPAPVHLLAAGSDPTDSLSPEVSPAAGTAELS